VTVVTVKAAIVDTNGETFPRRLLRATGSSKIDQSAKAAIVSTDFHSFRDLIAYRRLIQ
jgi:hypothetical protein